MSKKPTTRKAALADETKAAKFSRLASARVSKAVKNIKQIGNLSGSGYERTDAQVAAIRNYLVEAVNATLAKFAAKSGEKASEPELKI